MKKVRVTDKNKILVECDAKIKGRAALLSCVYSKFEEENERLVARSLSIEEMKGWQFKGFAKSKRIGKESYILLEIDEIYCAISGKKLQETRERLRIKLLQGIVKSFFNISGNVAIAIANRALRKFRIKIKSGDENFRLEGSNKLKKMKTKEFNKILCTLLKEYSVIYGERLAKSMPILLEKFSENLRAKPKKEWKMCLKYSF